MWNILTASLAICLALASATPISDDMSARIVGGVEATPHSYPSQVALYIHKGTKTYFCGGSLISNQWVLTAAQCLTAEHDYITVVLGVHNLNQLDPPVVTMNATNYFYHDDYGRETFKNDVGLLKLQKEVVFTEDIQPSVLAKGSERYDGDRGTTVGWGQTETTDLSLVLMKADVTIITNEECAAATDDFKEIVQPTHVCTSGEGNVGACSRDSGGPLFVDDVQVGIASYGTINCASGMPSGFMRVNDYYDWIMDTIARDKDTTDTPGTDAPGGAAGLDSLRLGVFLLVALYLAQVLK